MPKTLRHLRRSAVSRLHDNLRSRTVGSLYWKLLERGGYQGIQLIVQVVLARLLAPSDFGLVAILLVFINVGNVLVQSGLNTALVQTSEIQDKDRSTVFWLSMVFASLLYALVFMWAPSAASFYELPELRDALRVLGLLLFIGAFNSVQVALTSRRLDFKPIFISTLAAALVSGVVGVGMASAGLGYWALIGQQLSYQVASSLVLLIRLPWLPRLEFDVARAKEFYRFGWRLASSSLLDTVYLGAYDLSVGKVFSRTTLGYFGQGKKFPATLNALFDGSIQAVMLPAMSRLQDDSNRAKRALRRSLTTSTYLIVPIMFLLLVTAPSFVVLLLTEKWLGCVPYLQAFCLVYAVQPLQTANLQAISATGRSDIVLRMNLVKRSLGLVILGIAVFVLRSPLAVAGAAVVDAVLAGCINAIPCKRLLGYGLAEQLRDVAPAFLVSAGALGISMVATLGLDDGLLKLLLQTVTLIGAYATLSHLLRLDAYVYLRGTLVAALAGRRDLHSGT